MIESFESLDYLRRLKSDCLKRQSDYLRRLKISLKLGDHLKTSQGVYTHHGIYVGNEKVIHYSGLVNKTKAPCVEYTSLGSFSEFKEIKIVNHPIRRYSKKESIERAKSRLGENKYNVLSNNCEHFVNWCIEGEHESEQVTNVVNVGKSIAFGGAIAAAAGSAAIMPVATVYALRNIKKLDSNSKVYRKVRREFMVNNGPAGAFEQKLTVSPSLTLPKP